MPRVPAAQRRADLVAAAIEVVAQEGLEAATVRRIAAQADVSVGTVHYCFGSKEGLWEAVVEEIVQPELELALDDVDDDEPVEVVRAAFRAYWDLAGGNSDRQRVVYELLTHLVRQDDPGPDLARRMFRSATETVERFIRRYLGATGVTDRARTETLAALTVAVTDGVALAWIADGDDAKALRVLDTYALLIGQAISDADTSDSEEK